MKQLALIVAFLGLGFTVSAQTPVPAERFNGTIQYLPGILNAVAIKPANCTTIVAGVCTVTTQPLWARQSAVNGCLVSVEVNSVRMLILGNPVATAGILLTTGVYWIAGRPNILEMRFISMDAAGSNLNIACATP